jgi:dUTP pyrophosphatase
MKVKVQKLSDNAIIPYYATDGSVGLDITATSVSFDKDNNVVYGCGLAFEIPKGYVALLFPRSSNAKKDLLLSNAVGVLDSDYRGEVTFKFKRTKKGLFSWFKREKIYNVGDRIGQIIIFKHPTIEFVESEELSETTRGKGGYGSTGK